MLTALSKPLQLLCFALVLGGRAAYAEDSVATHAEAIMQLLDEGKFDEASTVFHYPPSYSAAALAADRGGVVRALEVMFRELGKVDHVAPTSLPNLFRSVSVSVGGGDLSYWESHPELNQTICVSYGAHAQNDGQVFFRLDFVQPADTHTWLLRAFGLAIPVAHLGAKNRIDEIAVKMFPALLTPPPR